MPTGDVLAHLDGAQLVALFVAVAITVGLGIVTAIVMSADDRRRRRNERARAQHLARIRTGELDPFA